ncbi:unnamed protein product [Echinostoma caproni]|uniref:26S proteasome non-ATPase regulatory subunit 9 n=1 Tax=Echinostoma caproni TaxID=27848 RepID=A0A183ALT9_9TREM|nr:unnamed protein product [Echinostoma caproni]
MFSIFPLQEDPAQTTVDVQQLRDKIQSLSSQKTNIEREIQSLSGILSENDQVGLKGNLLDNEGFPRNDIDLVAVRTARNRIIRLNNDHRTVMAALETALHQMHDLARKTGADRPSEEAMDLDQEVPSSAPLNPDSALSPFLLIDEVRPGSVAEQSGLEVGDLISKFGSVNADNFSGLQDIASVMRNTPPQGVIPLIVQKTSKQNRMYHIELVKPASAVGFG